MILINAHLLPYIVIEVVAEVHSLSPPTKPHLEHPESQEELTVTTPTITVTPEKLPTPDQINEGEATPPLVIDKQNHIVTEEDVRRGVMQKGSEERSESVSRKDTDSVDGSARTKVGFNGCGLL